MRREAMEMIQEVVPDIILLDLNLPGKSGLRIFLKRDKRNKYAFSHSY